MSLGVFVPKSRPLLFVAALPALFFSTLIARAADDPQCPFNLQMTEGRLVLSSSPDACGQKGPKCWRTSAVGLEYDDYNPGGYFDGRVSLRSTTESMEMGGWRRNFRDWEITEFIVTQGSGHTSAQLTIRTPVGQPDITLCFDEPDPTLMMIRHPELTPLMGELLAAMGPSDSVDLDSSVVAQVNPDEWETPAEMAESVAAALPRLNSPKWQERSKAEDELADLGRDGALYLLLRVDRRKLSAEQNLAIDRLVRRFPLLSDSDRELCRQDPTRLHPSRTRVALVNGDPTD